MDHSVDEIFDDANGDLAVGELERGWIIGKTVDVRSAGHPFDADHPIRELVIATELSAEDGTAAIDLA